MESRENIQTELQTLAPTLSQLDKQNVYSVPVGYFDRLAENIVAKVRPLFGEVKRSPYEIPEHYFDSLAASILEKIKGQQQVFNIDPELSEIAPTIASLDKINVYSVPTGYWEEFTVAVPGSTFTVTQAPGNKIRKWITYAAAASVLFFIVTGSYLYVNNHGKEREKNITIDQRLVQLNDAEIINYLIDNQELTQKELIPLPDEQNPEMNNLLKNTSDNEIENYLEYSDPAEKEVKGI